MYDDKAPPEVLPERKNPEKLPPTLAIAKTASDLNTAWKGRAKERLKEEMVIQFGTQEKPKLTSP